MHSGIDIPVKDGTPVYATVAGTVKDKDWVTDGGYAIIIEGDDGRLHSYMHLIDDTDINNKKKYPPKVKEKDKVKEGQLIGYSDSTVNQNSTDKVDPHLDYKVYTKSPTGKNLYVNPLSILPYKNIEIPKVEIINPIDGLWVGRTKKDKDVDIKTEVKTEEKDLSRVELFINKEKVEDANFNFEKEGRSEVIVKIGKDYYKDGKPYTLDPKKDRGYVEPTEINKTTDTCDTFVYQWDTQAFLNLEKKGFIAKVPIKLLAYQAKGDPGEKEIKVDVGSPTLKIKSLVLKGITRDVVNELYLSDDAFLRTTVGAEEEGVTLKEEIVKGRLKLGVRSSEPILTSSLKESEGSIEMETKVEGLEEGFHTAIVEILDEEGKEVIDSKQKVFFIDTIAPEILQDKIEDMIGVQGRVVNEKKVAFRPAGRTYHIPIKEDGSGIDRIEVEENKKIEEFTRLSLKAEEDRLIFPLEIWNTPYGERELTLKVYDRAGNMGEMVYRFKSVLEEFSKVIKEDPEEKTQIVRQYDFWFTQGGTTYFYRPDLIGVGTKAPIYIRTYRYTTVATDSPYLDVKPDRVEESGWRWWKITQKEKADDTLEATIKVFGPLYIDFTIMYDPPNYSFPNSIKILKEEPGPTNAIINHIALEISELEINLAYNEKANSLDASWKGRKTKDLSFILKVEEDEILPSSVREGGFQYRQEPPFNEGPYTSVLSVHDRLLNRWETKGLDFEVNMGPPEVLGFEYDYKNGLFKARIQDQGTEVEDLDIELYLNSILSPFNLDKESGEFKARLDEKPDTGIVTAQLFVTDRVMNQTTADAQAEFYTPGGGDTTSYVETWKPEIPKSTKDCKVRVKSKGSCLVEVETECIGWKFIFEGYLPWMSWRIIRVPGETITTETIDTCPPSISNLRYDKRSHKVRAEISDRSTPLSKLRISYWVGCWGLGPGEFRFNPSTGDFMGDLLAGDYEIFNVLVCASDGWGSAAGYLTIRLPKRPPDVSLTFDDFSDSKNKEFLNSLGLEHLLVGEYRDISGINDRLTELEIDGVIKRNYILIRRVDERTLLYYADLAEGRHRARLRAVDNIGLENEANIVFEINYRPRISNFRYEGERDYPFIAFIKDKGYDVTKDGINLYLDGRQIPQGQYYFDPKTGLFGVSGPIEITEGPHSAHLVVIDSHKNKAEAQICFGGPVGPGEGGLRVRDYSIWDFEGNGDGKSNPGEKVRLFVEIQSDLDILNAKGTLYVNHPFITVEGSEVEYGDIGQGQKVAPGAGFDLMIKEDFFSTTDREVEEVDLRLIITDRDKREWRLSLRIPVYRIPAIFIPGPTTPPPPPPPPPPPLPTSVSVKVTYPQNGVEYEHPGPSSVYGTYTVENSTIASISVVLNGTSLPVTINLNGTFSASIGAMLLLEDNVLVVKAKNTAGDEAAVLIGFKVKPLDVPD